MRQWPTPSVWVYDHASTHSSKRRRKSEDEAVTRPQHEPRIRGYARECSFGPLYGSLRHGQSGAYFRRSGVEANPAARRERAGRLRIYFNDSFEE